DRRLTWLAASVLVWGAAIFAKLISLQVIHHRQYLAKAASRQEVTLEVAAPRGAIYDRSGKTLAMSVPSQSVYVNPKKLPHIGIAAELLGIALKLDREDLERKLREAAEADRGFFWVKRKISAEEADALKKYGLGWIFIANESQRHYPNRRLAAHLLGSVN